jgi:hypothetical protein
LLGRGKRGGGGKAALAALATSAGDGPPGLDAEAPPPDARAGDWDFELALDSLTP